jgi:Sec-independent protein translocase protein TatA
VAIRIVWTKLPTLVKKEKAKMEEYKKYVKGMSTVREQMYKDYFKQLQTED